MALTILAALASFPPAHPVLAPEAAAVVVDGLAAAWLAHLGTRRAPGLLAHLAEVRPPPRFPSCVSSPAVLVGRSVAWVLGFGG